MCSISGSFDKSPDRLSNVHRMVEQQISRGPDGKGVIDRPTENVTFGHTRLSIIDLSNDSAQPIQSNPRYIFTYNGEAYNYKELDPYAKSDTLAIYNSICQVGLKQTIDKINGMFAIGLYDSQLKRIYLAVDRFAQKPLYYYHKDNKFYFSSWPAALYDLETSWDINKEALQSYWLLGSVMGEDSIFYGIKKLNASQLLIYDIQENKVTIERYWEPKYHDKTDGIEDLVLDAIDKTKIADVPRYVFLSGGIDSTLVASRNIEGLAVHLDSPEKQYAQHAADQFGIDLKIVYPETIETEEYLMDYSLKSGEPTMAGLIPYTTAKEVSKFSKVAISANGADELFFGYNRIHDELTYEQKNHLFRGSLFDSDTSSFPIDILFLDDRFKKGRWHELQYYVQFDLNKTLDFASMCHGLEVRNPFLDHRLVEMALSIPESVHRKQGNKTILKNILRKFGFKDEFLNRPKLGFSLHRKPERLDSLILISWIWCKDNGFLDVNDKTLNPRDKQYLQMSALGFYYWFRTWKNKIK